MKRISLLRLFFVLGLLSLVGCTLNVDSPQTPTVVVSPTREETAISRRTTASPTPSASATISVTSTHRPTDTKTPTPTASSTKTSTTTPTSTNTSTQIPSRTSMATATTTPTSTPTYPPDNTNTPLPSATPHRTQTPTQAIAQLLIPTATPRPSMTFTPFPTITPDHTQTEIAKLTTASPIPTRTPGGIYTLTPTTTAIPAPEDTQSAVGNGTFYDPNAPASGQDVLPIAPAGDVGPSGPSIPEQNAVVVSYAGQIVPVLTLPDGINTGAPIAQGDIFAVNSAGKIAAVYPDGELHIEGSPITISPSSQFGIHPNLSYGDLVWSPDGQRVAFRIDAVDPEAFNGIDSGVWVLEPETNRSWQVFRNTYQGPQQHEQRRAIRISWAPNGTALSIQVETPLGLGTVFFPATHSANEWVDALPYADATWTRDSRALIVSGSSWNGPSVVGRVELDAYWTYTGYLEENTTGVHMQAAAQLSNNRIAFIGTTSSNTFALYTIPANSGAIPIQVSATLNGRIVMTEWNADRTAILVTAMTNNERKLWIVRTDGVARDITPAGGALNAAHWR